MYKGCRNIRVHTIKDDPKNLMHIYLNISGKEYYVKSQRYAAPLHYLLKEGIAIEELQRWDGRKRIRNIPANYIRSGKLEHALHHLFLVIDYVLEEEGLISGGERCV